MAINQKYSFKDFTTQDLSGLDASEFNGQGDVVGSCFAQYFAHGDVIPASGGKAIFPAGMTGVTFKRCNLDNVELPAGNTVTSDGGISSSQKTIQPQNDLEDWEMEDSGGWQPKQPLAVTWFVEHGVSINPVDIPVVKRTGKSLITEKIEEALGV